MFYDALNSPKKEYKRAVGYVLGEVLLECLLAKGGGKVADVAGDFAKGAKAVMKVTDDGIELIGKYADDVADVAINKYSWGNKYTLSDHYRRHGAGVGASDELDYAKMANDFFNNRSKYQVKVDEEGIIIIYDDSKNLFGAYNPDGTSRTFFSPSNGNAYFARQPGN